MSLLAVFHDIWSISLLPLISLYTTPLSPPVPLLVPTTTAASTSSGAMRSSITSPQWEPCWRGSASEFGEPLERRGEVGNVLLVGIVLLLGRSAAVGLLESSEGLWLWHARVDNRLLHASVRHASMSRSPGVERVV